MATWRAARPHGSAWSGKRADNVAPATPSDAELRAWWSRGEWHRVVPLIRALVHECVPFAVLYDHDTTEDIATWVTVRCWALPYTPELPKTFVARLARNRALDLLKLGPRRFCQPLSADNEAVPVTGQSDALDALVREEDLSRLRRAFALLSPDLRRPLYLHDIHQRPVRDLALMFNVSEGVMRMRLHRARRRLGRLMHRVPSDVVPSRLRAYAVTDMGRSAGLMVRQGMPGTEGYRAAS